MTESNKRFWAEVEMLEYLSSEREHLKLKQMTASPKAWAMMQERAAKMAEAEVLESRAAAGAAAISLKRQH